MNSTIINSQDIRILCREMDPSANNTLVLRETQDENLQHENFEKKESKWSRFKKGISNAWGKAKKIATEIVIGLTLTSSLIRATAKLVKNINELREAFA